MTGPLVCAKTSRIPASFKCDKSIKMCIRDRSDTVHVMVLIAINQEKSLSSASIAESVHTNPGFVRQLMLKLKKAGLMTSIAGHARPSLSKPADQITLLDIYKAVEGEKPLLHLDTHTLSLIHIFFIK